MTEFLSTAQLERIRGTDTWRLLVDFTAVLDTGERIIVPHGFITDKASVPLGVLIKRDDKHIIDGALVHDYLYTIQQIDGKWITRKRADEVLIDLCKFAGMGWFKRQIVWAGVRMGGWKAWNKRADEIGNFL